MALFLSDWLVMPLLMQPSIVLASLPTPSIYIELAVHQNPLVLFQRSAPQLGRFQSVLYSWVMISVVEDFILVLVELHW